MEVPEGGIHVMPVADEGCHKHLHQFAQFAKGCREHRGCAAKGIAGFRINNCYIPVVQDFAYLTNQHSVTGELAGADASHAPQEPFPADEPIYRHHVICLVGIDDLGCNLEVHEGVVVAKEDVRRFQVLRSRMPVDNGLVNHHIRPAQELGERLQVPSGADRVTHHIKAWNRFFHFRSGFAVQYSKNN